MSFGSLPNCDRCGRFMLPGAPGTSWVMVPATDWNSGDERERCARCTDKHGPATCSQQYRADICQGYVPLEGCRMTTTQHDEERGR